MELIKETYNMHETRYQDTAKVYVEGNIIVPDVKPDILKILQVDAESRITSKGLTDGRIQVSGSVDLAILYVPEREDDTIQSIHTTFEFSEKIEAAGITDAMKVHIETDVERVEFNLINSRKLNVKSTVGLCCTVSGNREVHFVTGFEDGEAECKMQPIKLHNVSVDEECDLLIREQLEVPSGKVSVKELLKVDARINDQEIKALTGKVIVKGALNVCMLYIGTSDQVEFMEMDVPFTEVLDLEDITEDADCELNLSMCKLEYDLEEDSDGDLRILNVQVRATAYVKATTDMELSVVSDFYCPGYNTEVLCDNFSLDEIVAKPMTQNTMREFITIDKQLPQISSVYNVIAKACVTKTVVEDGKVSVEGYVEAYILYLTDRAESPVYSFRKEIPFRYLLDSPHAKSGMDCMVKAEVVHTGYNLNAANEVELRCILTIRANVIHKRTMHLISDCKIEPLSGEEKKGIVIYFVQPGDTLWNIAKQYRVSVSDVVCFNKLSEDEHLSPGCKLIIPAVCKK